MERACVRGAWQVHIIDDDSIISSVLDTCSSTRVRKTLMDGQSVVEMVGTAVDRCVGATLPEPTLVWCVCLVRQPLHSAP